MSTDAGDRLEPAAPPVEQEFTVTLPASAETQAIPQHEPTRALPPLPPPSEAATPTGETVDPLPGQVGVALFWITVGWWLFFLVRVLAYFVRFGGESTILIRTIDDGAEETILAAVVSVVAALLLLFGRGTRGRSPMGYASAALAVVTVAVAVWRLVP